VRTLNRTLKRASQSWSTGKVGMYGKSYDGVTGLIGVNHRPPGLAAVVSQEPVYLTYTRPDTIQGDPGRQLADYLSETITVPPETMRDSVSSSFQLPPRQRPRP
jgi:predicted acyl esterase